MFSELSSFMIEPLNAFFGGTTLEAFEVLREGGRATPAKLLKVNHLHFVIDLSLSNPQSGQSRNYFDRARYRLSRLSQLKKLGRYYPETLFLVTDGPWNQDSPQQLLMVLQHFFSFPVCEFIDYESILELHRILKRAAKLGMLLDYNQNHWLYQAPAEGPGRLYYVDKDYVNDGRTFENAVEVGFDQCSLYLTQQNAHYFAKALVQMKEESVQELDSFSRIIRDRIQQNLDDLIVRSQTRIVQDRIECFELILNKLFLE